MMKRQWSIAALNFLQSLHDPQTAGARSVPGGSVTLYGTCYALLARFYLGDDTPLTEPVVRFIANCQDAETGLTIGPELKNFTAAPGAMHDREHLLLHLTCAAIPVCRQFGIQLPHPVRDAHRFCDENHLQDWLDKRKLKNAWFEGNNILFVGQLLVYLRDVEKHPGAQRALDLWFRWLDENIDSKTSLWGTDGHCPAMEAVYGSYHQLLVYYHENHPIRNPAGLVDTVLSLQHLDGGFNPGGNGGACEDVDCVDILVNLYKRNDYRRAEIRCALRRCLWHIMALQNPDGGFPYNRDCPQSHMGIPGTDAAPNQSTTFATWFRVHTLALIAEILTDEPELQFDFRFTNNLSMGWHRAWDKNFQRLTQMDCQSEKGFESAWRRRQVVRQIKTYCASALKVRRLAGRLKRKVLR
jgi:hypothetical protein